MVESLTRETRKLKIRQCEVAISILNANDPDKSNKATQRILSQKQAQLERLLKAQLTDLERKHKHKKRQAKFIIDPNAAVVKLTISLDMIILGAPTTENFEETVIFKNPANIKHVAKKLNALVSDLKGKARWA